MLSNRGGAVDLCNTEKQYKNMEHPRRQECPQEVIRGVLGRLWFLLNEFEHQRREAAAEIQICEDTNPSFAKYLRGEVDYHKQVLKEAISRSGADILAALPEKLVITGEIEEVAEDSSKKALSVECAQMDLVDARIIMKKKEEGRGLYPEPVLLLSDGDQMYSGSYGNIEWSYLSEEVA